MYISSSLVQVQYLLFDITILFKFIIIVTKDKVFNELEQIWWSTICSCAFVNVYEEPVFALVYLVDNSFEIFTFAKCVWYMQLKVSKVLKAGHPIGKEV